jgi:hypothetical protein
VHASVEIVFPSSHSSPTSIFPFPHSTPDEATEERDARAEDTEEEAAIEADALFTAPEEAMVLPL